MTSRHLTNHVTESNQSNTIMSAPGESSSSAKSCYNNKGIVTYKCLKKLLAENDIQLFDVRTRQEVAAGKIPGATNIPLDELQEALSLSPDEFQKKYNVRKPGLDDGNITVHCRSGMRADSAIQIFNNLGYKRYFRAHNFTGGWTEWQKAMEADMAAANE
ncbi:thiosulfate:glutathione sulfurtransferase-like [Actinia tenebrosa]|uniref:Thiosulfate:glutathione sulfurtransferase-like n=1 Tax=Actinia tenebrosa TaxID=6105 RepID=A0A6P8H782_ACTTE|nr:thiosulfate:glutathione sulfurtransferase-like [Actinia tenebrosa]